MIEAMRSEEKIEIRLAEERGRANHGWLHTYHTFSFADYYDRDHMGYRSLRVINEDRIEAGQGFGTHPHRNMEIITYVIEGELEHKDSMGNGSIIKAGNVQKMTAGTGVRHSEFNPSSDRETHLLQIWILPDVNELSPAYEEIAMADFRNRHGLTLIGSKTVRPGVIHIHQDVLLYRGYLNKGEEIVHSLRQGRGIWMQMIKGKLHLDGRYLLSEGDGASVEAGEELSIKAYNESEFLLFDLGP